MSNSAASRAVEQPTWEETYGLPAYHTRNYIPQRLVEEMYDGRTLARLLASKLTRKLKHLKRSSVEEDIVTFFGQIAVFDRLEHHYGGLAFGMDIPRVLNELGIGRCERLFEFCAGPGYVGYSLLNSGWCRSLVLADIDPTAVAAARRTAVYNELQDVVTVYESDVFDAIPESEQWDLVIGNPPHFLDDPDRPDNVKVVDRDWQVHERFYTSVARHMRPGGVVVMSENTAATDPEVFADMIRRGGGNPVAAHPGTDIQGRPNGLYYHVSEW
jgi:methylase of polypeptide subunit release factors